MFINTKQLLDLDIKIKEEIELRSVSTLKAPLDDSLIFIKKISKDVLNLEQIKGCLIIAYPNLLEDYPEGIFKNNTVYLIDNPRLCFIKILSKMVDHDKVKNYKEDYIDLGFSRYVHKTTKIHNSVVIEANVTIEKEVEIGKSTILSSGTQIKSNVKIGKDCFIGSGTIIGNQGFGAERDKDDKIYMMPHVGGVIIEDRVNIGCNTTIVAGTINPTIIESEVKIDDLTIVAHNCHIKKSVIICGGTSIGGSVMIGERTWIGSSTIIKQSIKIGSDVTTGIGAVIMKNIKNGITVLGNPAEEISKFVNMKRKLRKL